MLLNFNVFVVSPLKLKGFLMMAEIPQELRRNLEKVFWIRKYHKIKQRFKVSQDELSHHNIPFHSNTAKFSVINLPRNIIYFVICACFNIPSQEQVVTAQPRNKYRVCDLPDKWSSVSFWYLWLERKCYVLYQNFLPWCGWQEPWCRSLLVTVSQCWINHQFQKGQSLDCYWLCSPLPVPHL